MDGNGPYSSLIYHDLPWFPMIYHDLPIEPWCSFPLRYVNLPEIGPLIISLSSSGGMVPNGAKRCRGSAKGAVAEFQLSKSLDPLRWGQNWRGAGPGRNWGAESGGWTWLETIKPLGIGMVLKRVSTERPGPTWTYHGFENIKPFDLRGFNPYVVPRSTHIRRPKAWFWGQSDHKFKETKPWCWETSKVRRLCADQNVCDPQKKTHPIFVIFLYPFCWMLMVSNLYPPYWSSGLSAAIGSELGVPLAPQPWGAKELPKTCPDQYHGSPAIIQAGKSIHLRMCFSHSNILKQTIKPFTTSIYVYISPFFPSRKKHPWS